MRVSSWAVRVLRQFPATGGRLLAAPVRLVVGLLTALTGRAIWFVTGLTLVAVSIWPFSPELAGLTLGLLIIRDAERPDPDRA